MIDPKKFGSKAITILPGSVVRVENDGKEIDIELAEEITVRGGKITQHFLVRGKIIAERENLLKKEKNGEKEENR